MSQRAPSLCTICGTALEPEHEACPLHGTPSSPAGLSAAQPPSPEEGETLVGQEIGEYRVRRRIGQGGMGIVYEAEHVTIGRRVALKVLREEHAHGPHARDLLSEARAASAVHHRSVIGILGFGQQAGVGQYLVMEYLEGQPLSELISREAPLPPAQAMQWLIEVLEALSAAHSQGVIHRDLKPSNIFLVQEPGGEPFIKVLDFGLAKRSRTPDGTVSQTHSDVLVGSPYYMAPEQALNEPMGPRTDLYAVGVIAFELLTGRRPFPGRSHLEMVSHHLRTPPPQPSFYVALSPELEALVLRLLAKDPAQRPASASEVARELRALRQSPGGSSPHTPSSDVAPLHQAQRSPAFAFMEEPTLYPPSPGARQAAPPTKPPASSGPEEPPASRRRQGAVAGGLLVLLAGGTLLLNRPPSPQAVEAAKGTLHVTVKGAWADVWVDGTQLGRVPPMHLYVLTAGQHELELRSPGFTPHRQQITIPANGTLPYSFQFEPGASTAPAP